MKRATKKPVKQKRWADATLAIHAGEEKFHLDAPAAPAVTRASNFTFSGTEEMKRWAEGKSRGYIYTRFGNPTLAIAERKIAALEGAEEAVVAASGTAAIPVVLLAQLRAGDELIATRQLYGGRHPLFL